jgi:hypothetical protein
MPKLLNFIMQLASIFLDALLLFVVFFVFAIRTAPVQTFLAQRATSFLSKELKADIQIDQLAVVFIDRIALNGVYVSDQNNETLVDMKTIMVNLKGFDLIRGIYKVQTVSLNDGDIHLQRDKENGTFNYQFLIDYFNSQQKKKKKGVTISVENISIDNIHFRYDDWRNEHTAFGMDYSHLDLKEINLNLRRFNTDGEQFSGNIRNLSAIESCGFVLNKFAGQFEVGNKGIYVKNLAIKTPETYLKMSRLGMVMNQLPDIYTFVDSVAFDSKINPSVISMRDVSYFATALEGMDQIVKFNGKVKDKVNRLVIKDFNLKTGDKTQLQGSLVLPDFSNFEGSFFQEKVDYAYIDFKDLKSIKLPLKSSTKHLVLDEKIERLEYLEAKGLRMDGFYNRFVIAAEEMQTALGTVHINKGIKFYQQEGNADFYFASSRVIDYDLKVDSFELGEFLGDKNFGELRGQFHVSGHASSFNNIIFDSIAGEVQNFNYLGYDYQNIRIQNGRLENSQLFAKVDIADDNLKLNYDGFIDFGKEQKMIFEIDLSEAILENLGYSKAENSKLSSKFTVDLSGSNMADFQGEIGLKGLVYTEDGKRIELPSLDIKVKRGKLEDHIFISSEVADLDLIGKIDYQRASTMVHQHLHLAFPSLIAPPPPNKKAIVSNDWLNYKLVTKETEEVFAIFAPNLFVRPGTELSGAFLGATNTWTNSLQASYISYGPYVGETIKLHQKYFDNQLSAELLVGQFNLNDSIQVQDLKLESTGINNVYQSKIDWNPNTLNPSEVLWTTTFPTLTEIDFNIHPSFVTIKGKKWDIKHDAQFDLSDGKFVVKNFKFEREDQYLSVDGVVAKNMQDRIKIKVAHVRLDDFGDLMPTPMDLSGELNGFAQITDPFESLTYSGDASIKDLAINKEPVGNVFVQSAWKKGTNSVQLVGDMNYLNYETFRFEGNYFPKLENDNLDFKLVFDKTNIALTNAFMDPQVVSNIEGNLNGKISVRGTPNAPKLSGAIDLVKGNAKVGLLGVNFKTEGKIKIDQYGFYMDNIPIIDEEGNKGSLVGSIYHSTFQDWNFDLAFNLIDEHGKRDPSQPWKMLPLKKFLVMNTDYKEGDYYYGKGYVTGVADIYGYTDNLEITTDLKTQKGTYINFPMYGTSDLEDEDDFVQFINKDTTIQFKDPKIDFTGVKLDLNFDLTSDAKLKIIFDERIGDEISADGSGKINMGLSNLGDLSLNGTYTLNDGVYNFAMGPIKQNFYIEPGGFITWTGDPYNANLNLSSFYKVSANLAELSSDQLTSEGSSNQEVLCYLNITESLMQPTINFDIKAPRASESGKALLNRVKSDPDELNRQFFSLLLSKSFTPLRGSRSAGGGAALDLAANQINAMLGQLSNSYKMAVNMDANSITGDRSFEVGVSKEFLDDRLILTGSFGVENATQSAAEQSQNYLIGDVNLEYLLNETGTFRVNIFNESNQNKVLQQNNQGLFKQGVGLHYQEDFNNYKDFKIWQTFLDVFREKGNKRYPQKRKKSQELVPVAPAKFEEESPIQD